MHTTESVKKFLEIQFPEYRVYECFQGKDIMVEKSITKGVRVQVRKGKIKCFADVPNMGVKLLGVITLYIIIVIFVFAAKGMESKVREKLNTLS